MINLLLRFLDPVEGQVTIGGRDLREYRQEDVRRDLRPRRPGGPPVRLDDPREPAPRRPGADDDELSDALRRARLDEWVASLPRGLDTLVGEEGTQALGRPAPAPRPRRAALLAGAPVLLLDEPTAHLDPPTARALMHDVLDAAGGQSVLLITHRPEGLERIDEIVTLYVARTRPRG